MRHRSSRGGSAPPPMPLMVVPGHDMASPGAWPGIFGRRAPLVVEIGFGKDTFLLERAEACPDRDHVGVERDPERVRFFVGAAQGRGLTNVRALPVSAELALGQCFEPGSVAEVHVYFPDPWPKERHAPHRLVQPWFPRDVHRVLEPGGLLRMATDDAAYIEQILDVVEGSGLFANGAGVAATSPTPALGWETKFERLWRGQGRTIRHASFSPIRGASATLRTSWTGSGARGDTPT
ncbi:MAG: tRNA (guanosine(46)-N7)-methyltransferase TrmB [Planctomycetes bacterium]|nr:tRNA (guanosine(46)-N7)-methyltransferase TrmB [Planctomycetota bacterium]